MQERSFVVGHLVHLSVYSEFSVSRRTISRLWLNRKLLSIALKRSPSLVWFGTEFISYPVYSRWRRRGHLSVLITVKNIFESRKKIALKEPVQCFKVFNIKINICSVKFVISVVKTCETGEWDLAIRYKRCQ